ncbi:PDDEXK family nuclease [Thermus tengchongensis]|uniref:Uma2 family endonuclease n=1 Tax=Thermus tengchongensis TaxID=1214928 RepID=UPI001F3F4E9E|nr:Uma2 family endonuclease [Thermus tengchongensis]
MAVRHRFKVEEVLALSALEPEARLELLEGEVYEMAPISSEHAGRLDWLLQTLATRTLGQAVYREPQETAYRHRLLVKKGERIAPLLLPQAEILWSPPL